MDKQPASWGTPGCPEGPQKTFFDNFCEKVTPHPLKEVFNPCQHFADKMYIAYHGILYSGNTILSWFKFKLSLTPVDLLFP